MRITKQNKILKKCPGLLFLILDLEKIFFCFLCHAKKNIHALMFLGECKVLKDLDKIY